MIHCELRPMLPSEACVCGERLGVVGRRPMTVSAERSFKGRTSHVFLTISGHRILG